MLLVGMVCSCFPCLHLFLRLSRFVSAFESEPTNLIQMSLCHTSLTLWVASWKQTRQRDPLCKRCILSERGDDLLNKRLHLLYQLLFSSAQLNWVRVRLFQNILFIFITNNTHTHSQNTNQTLD